MAADMKLAQYAHLAPKVTFLAQFSGAAVGALINYVLMNSIVDNQRAILLSVEGTNIWSGQAVQQFNTLVSDSLGSVVRESWEADNLAVDRFWWPCARAVLARRSVPMVHHLDSSRLLHSCAILPAAPQISEGRLRHGQHGNSAVLHVLPLRRHQLQCYDGEHGAVLMQSID